MELINCGGVLELVRAYRLCWMSGKFSGGKTSFALYLAKQFLEEGYRLITNNSAIWAEDLREIGLYPSDHPKHANHLRAVVILDEGGLHFKSGKQIEQIAAYAAKMDAIYIVPSFFPPARDVQVLTIQPLFSFQSSGVPLIVYRWAVRLGGFKEGGWFAWWFPQEVYGVYSRQDPGAEPEAIVEFLIERTREFRARMGHGKGGRGKQIPVLEEEVSEVDVLADVARALDEHTQAISPVSTRGPKSRRK